MQKRPLDEALRRVAPQHLPVILRIAKTRLRPFFCNPRAMIAPREHVALEREAAVALAKAQRDAAERQAQRAEARRAAELVRVSVSATTPPPGVLLEEGTWVIDPSRPEIGRFITLADVIRHGRKL